MRCVLEPEAHVAHEVVDFVGVVPVLGGVEEELAYLQSSLPLEIPIEHRLELGGGDLLLSVHHLPQGSRAFPTFTVPWHVDRVLLQFGPPPSSASFP